MRRLVALDLPGGRAFLDAVRSCLDAGEAIAPVDQRLEGPARARFFDAVRPTHRLGEDGRTAISGGEPVEEGDLVVVATSGTTGAPKAVVLTEDAIRASAVATSERLCVTRADRWLCALPMSHVGGLSVALRAVFTGTPLALIDRFEVRRYAAEIAAGATLTSVVPTTLRRLGADLAARFRAILVGGSSMPDDLPDNAVATYGMTETGSGVVYGGVPLRGVDVEIGEGGAILLRCPMLARAYRDGTPIADARGFFRTGDIGAIGADGRLAVFGRGSEMIVSGGENVWPAAVERLLATAPGVTEIAVTGVPDPEWGQRLVGLVVASDEGPPDLAALNARCRAEIGPWAALKALVSVPALPRTAIGKLDRNALSALAAHA